jgi:hypothetical protein
MAIIGVLSTVSDYAKFRAHFDKNTGLRTAAGITNPRVYRNADMGNEFIVLADVADVAKAREALMSPAYRATMQEAGLVGGPPKIYAIE